MNYRANNQNKNKSGLITALIFLFVNMALSQNSYPINDPRNPNCPCHKYQKLADDEFKNLLARNITVPNLSNNSQVQLELKKEGITNTDEKYNGISADDLLRISIIEGNNVLGEIKNEPTELIIPEQKINKSAAAYSEKQNQSTKHWKSKHKRHKARYKQFKRVFDVRGWDIWKRKRITSACFHWK